MLGRFAIAILAAAVTAAPAHAIEEVDVPPSRQRGLDMIVVDEGALPQEPELARNVPVSQDASLTDAPADLLAPVNKLYTDLRLQLDRYSSRWGALPQVLVPSGGAPMKLGSTDPRVAVLRERLGLPARGGFDKALQTRVTEYQEAHGLPRTGAVGAETIASLNRGAAHFESLIRLNMERARRLPASDDKRRYVLVDAGSAQLWMYEGARVVDTMKVVVGSPKSETPMMAALMRYSSVNPYWNVPPDLVRTLIAPRVLSDGMTYLTDRRYQILDTWGDDAQPMNPANIDWRAVADGKLSPRVRQLPGGGNSMGDIKFMMPNEYGIYLHDTPNKALFDQEDRWVSNGCIRVEDARRLARWLHGEMPKGRSPDREDHVDLAEPVPVYITYLTAGVAGNRLVFRPDRYERDATLLARFRDKANPMVDADERFRQLMTLDVSFVK